MQTQVREASQAVWDSFYRRGEVPWQSKGLTGTAEMLLGRYAKGPSLLEIGCGTGADSTGIAELGFEYLGIDISEQAIREAEKLRACSTIRFLQGDFFRWIAKNPFDVVYEKGVFHGLSGVRRRNSLTRRVAKALKAGGMWITVCGSADHRRTDFSHGAIYLRDLISPVEIYFEVLEILKAPYGLADEQHEFDAWYGVFRRR